MLKPVKVKIQAILSPFRLLWLGAKLPANLAFAATKPNILFL